MFLFDFDGEERFVQDGHWEEVSGMYRENVENVCVLITFCCDLRGNVYDGRGLTCILFFSEMEVVCKR